MMIRLYPEQLRAQLTEGLRAAYLLLGNDPLLLQESQIRRSCLLRMDNAANYLVQTHFLCAALRR